jgi:phospholipid/cholesterol/gamma-HCH transport system ATP-binding protein
VILGQSGCGKSVLLKHLIRLLEPDQGRVRFEGRDVSGFKGEELIAFRRRFGMLFQSAALLDSMTVAENVGLGLREAGAHTPAEIEAIVADKLELVGLMQVSDWYPAELSGGMRKRVGLARAIAASPELLLYDEPTTGLDPVTADLINELIVTLNEKLRVTSIAVTHDLRSAFRIADRLIMLHQGRVHFDGSPEAIRASDDPTVRQFVAGSSLGSHEVRP